MRNLKTISLPSKMLNAKIKKVVARSGPIPCIGIMFENGYRMDIATFDAGPPQFQVQVVEPKDNPYSKHFKDVH
jgi:hypothetical protein